MNSRFDGTRFARLTQPHVQYRNDRTVYGGAMRFECETFEQVLHSNSRRIRNQVRETTRQGVLIVALSTRNIEGLLWLQASEGPRLGIIGRHSMCDLAIEGHERLALRHVAVAVELVRDTIRVRVFDLASEAGTFDNKGEPLVAVDGEAPMLFQAAGLAFLCLETGSGACEVDAIGAVNKPRAVRGQSSRNRRASAAEDLLGIWERVEGTLLVRSRDAETHLKVGRTALSRGVLIGRYPRCAGAATLAHDECVSRVHALVISIGGEPVAIDVASTNGVWVAGQSARLARLNRDLVCLTENSAFQWQRHS